MLNIPEKKKGNMSENTTFLAGENYFENAAYKGGKCSEAKRNEKKEEQSGQR